MIDHLEIQSTTFHKDSQEAKNQPGTASSKSIILYEYSYLSNLQFQLLLLWQKKHPHLVRIQRRSKMFQRMMTMKMNKIKDLSPDHQIAKIQSHQISVTVENKRRINFLLLKEQLKLNLMASK